MSTKEKPEISKVMMVTMALLKESDAKKLKGKYKPDLLWRHKDGIMHANYIIPLARYQILEYNTIEYHNLIGLSEQVLNRFKGMRYKAIAFSFTNDARVLHSMDWSDLGCFRMIYKIVGKPMLLTFSDKLAITVHKKEGEYVHERVLTLPDRTKWY